MTHIGKKNIINIIIDTEKQNFYSKRKNKRTNKQQQQRNHSQPKTKPKEKIQS